MKCFLIVNFLPIHSIFYLKLEELRFSSIDDVNRQQE